MSSFVTAAFIALSTLSAVAEAAEPDEQTEPPHKQTEPPHHGTAERWSTSAQLHIAPLEDYPNWGGSVDTLFKWRRWRFGGEATVYVPQHYGNVSRFILLVQPSAQFLAIDARRMSWSVGAGVGVGVFNDSYDQVYDTVTRVAPGFSLNTELEWKATPYLHPTLGFRGVAYFAQDIADDQWLQFTVGARFLWGRL